MNVEKLVEALWSLILPSIRSNYPIYFNFTSNSLRAIFPSFQLPTENLVEDINKIANTFYLYDSAKISISDKAFEPVWGEISCAILLACQQVLIVEQMAETEEHSANAYFPWFRRAIYHEQRDNRSSPIEYEDFEKIWIRLSRETVLLGGDYNLLNIEFGRKKGADQAKRFPLSQALLSKEDSLRLIEAIGLETIRKKQNQDLLFIMLQEKKCLTARGRKLISLSWMQEKILAQLKSYSLSDARFELYKKDVQKNISNTQNFYLKAFNDEMNSTMFSSQISFAVFNMESDTRENNNELVEKFIVENIYGPGLVFMPFSDAKESWILSKEKFEIPPNTKVMVCFIKESFDKALLQIEQFFGESFDNLKLKNIFMRNDLQYFFFIPKSLIKVHAIAGGQLVIEREFKKIEKPIFEDGISLDSSGSVFSSSYLPNFVIISGRRYELTGPVIVQGHKTTFDLFRTEMKNFRGQEKYLIELSPGVSFYLSVSGIVNPIRNIGFKVENSLVKPIGEWVNTTIGTIHTLYEFDTSFKLKEPHKKYEALLELKKAGKFEALEELLKNEF